ncbi:YhdP family protein [Ningiella sp. W23]|uniref:YhdP family protein n=1 Tax=Ningiella sp. W23 TaxID=3023715 RepID=UPI003757F1D4
MSKSSKYAALALRQLWTAAAVALVIIALGISLLRYSLPLLDDRKHLIENYVLTEYGVDLTIGSVSAMWKASGPSLQFTDVHLRQNEQSPVAVQVQNVYIAVEFWSSIFSRQLQSRKVTLSDLNVTVDVKRLAGGSSDFPVVDALESLFLEQLSQFSITNSELSFVNADAQNKVRIRQLSWLNQDNRHQGLGEFSLDGFASNTAVFVLDLTGNIESYSGILYAKGQDLDISGWLNDFVTQHESDAKENVQIDSSIKSAGNFELWASIDQGRFTSVSGKILPSQLTYTDANQLPLISSISADFYAAPHKTVNEQNKWYFGIDNFNFSKELDVQNSDVNEALMTGFRGQFTSFDDIQVHNTQALELDKLIPLLSIYDSKIATLASALDMRIKAPTVQLSFSSSGLNAIVKDSVWSWSERDKIPGVNGLLMDLYLDENRGLIELSAEQTDVFSQNMFERDLALENLDIPIWLTRSNMSRSVAGDDLPKRVAQKGWSLSSTEGMIKIDGLLIHPDFSYRSVDKALSVISDVETLALARVPEFLPKNLMGENVRRYLSQAFTGGGTVEAAHILWQGDASKFPFSDNSGVFQASVAIDDADFVFSKAWPTLNELDISLLFENNSLTMRADSGKLAGVNLTHLDASIESLAKSSLLTIDVRGDSTGEDVAQLMLQSSLETSLGRVLSEDVIVDGEVSTDLRLLIPLADPNNTRAIGEAVLNQSQVKVAALGLNFADADGVISFDNEALSIDALNATLLDQAVSISLQGQQQEESYSLNLDINGQWDAKPIVERYATHLNGKLSGSFDWNLGLELALTGKNYRYQAQLNSSMLALESSLPAPFYKSARDAMPLKVVAQGDNIASTITAKIGGDVSFEGVLPHKEKQFSRAHLALGQTDFVGMGVGFSISANLASIDFENWYQAVNGLTRGLEYSEKPIFSVPERIFAQADQVLIGGTRITDVDVTAKRLDRDWRFDINADQIRGQLDISSNWVSEGVRFDADYIKLSDIDLEASAKEDATGFEPQSLPMIRLSCKQCEVGSVNLGRLTLEAEPNDDGIEITRLEVETKTGAISATGQWYKRHQDHYTFLSGDLRSGDFGQFLSGFGLDSGIKDSGAAMDFRLTWKDSPMDFGFADLDGTVDWSLSDGYMTEVSDKGSRIFTLLSLNSLVRKLSLDFRDVFAKGFFYDEMLGSIQITDGKADTRDTRIDGAAGEIEIYGYTDLVSKELNYNVSFAPNVTGNLPVLVYFFTVSPPSALAALAIDQVLTSAKVISNVNYSVSGTIDNPVLIETGRQSTDVDLPSRRVPELDENSDEFLPPTIEDFLPLEQGDG